MSEPREICFRCKYYLYHVGLYGVCRRHAPVAPKDMFTKPFPEMRPEHWCGEFELKAVQPKESEKQKDH